MLRISINYFFYTDLWLLLRISAVWIPRKEVRMGWKDVYSQREGRLEGERQGGKQVQKEGWRKLNSDCLLDKILVFTQMTHIIVRSSSNIIWIMGKSLYLLNCILQKINYFFHSLSIETCVRNFRKGNHFPYGFV